MIKTSLNKKLVVAFSSILLLVLILNIVINSLLLPRVYRNDKIQAMTQLHTQIYSKYENNKEAEIVDVVKNVLSSENLRVFIWDENDRLIIDSLPLSSEEEIKPPEEEFRNREFENPHSKKAFGGRFFFNRKEAFIFYSDIDDENIINENELYCLFSFKSYDDIDSENLYLRGYLPNGYKLLIQMPFASVDKAVDISNTLTAMVGAIMLLIGIIVVAIMSKTIVKPVKELSSIAKSMEKLDFSKKCEIKTHDEIGSLAESINSLSDKLKNTINELYEKNEALERDNKLKTRIDTMRREFIANASHELKTPIALISGYAEGLKDNVAGSEEARQMYSNVIIEEAENMDRIIRQMLDLMELEGTETFEGSFFELDLLAKSVVDTFSIMLEGKGVSVEISSEGDCTVFGDYFRIYQAALNFISNAINYVDENKKIKVLSKKIGDKVEFSVYNSGCTIPENEIDNIWEKFYKVDKARTRTYGGSGLGLSIVASTIKLHNGTYGVRNYEEGVEFYFTLNKESNYEN